MKNRKFISVLLSFSLIFGTILTNAVSVSFDEIETESNISFEDIETEETVSEELTNTDSNIYYDEIDSSEAAKEQEENIKLIEQPALFSDRANQEVQVSVTNKPVVDVVLSSKETSLDLDNFETDLRSALKDLGINDTDFVFKTANTVTSITDNNNASQIINSWNTFPIGLQSNWYYDSASQAITSSVNEPYETGFYSKNNGKIKNITLSGDIQITDTRQPVGYFIRFTESKTNPDRYNGYFLWTSAYSNSITSTNNGRVVILFKVEGMLIDHNKRLPYSFISPDIKRYAYQAMPLDVLYYNGAYRMGWYWQSDSIPNYGGFPQGTILQNGSVATHIYDKNLKTTVLGYSFLSTPLTQKFNLKIEAKNSSLKVYFNNSNIISVNDSSYNNGYYGLFETSNVTPKFYNVNVNFQVYKTYKEILTQPEWREEAHHIVVGVDDEIDDSLTGNGLGESLSRTLNDKIHLLYWGTDTNKTDTEAFISYNDGKGAFYDNNNYINCINETALYIKNLIDQTKESQYVIVGQKTNIDVLPAELKNNASSDDYPQGRWFIHHDYQYFDNNTGLSTQSEFYTPNLLCEFDKPGKYEIYFDDQLVKEIYAHRRPVAEFGMQVNGTSVSLNSESYDLDSNENIGYGKGIASESWYYKESNETTWHSGKLDTIDLEKTYIIKLEVTDKQGESNYTTKYVGSGIPVAAFNYASDTINQYNPLNVRNTSYDPKGLDIISQEWILKKNGSTVGTYSSPLTDFSSLGTGNYTYTLTVTNSQGIKSEAYTKAFNVVDDNIEPSVIINPTNCDWKTGTQDVSVIFSDGESGFQKWRYAITNSQTKPSSGWSDYKTSSSDTITVTETGIQYLHIEALDNAGNLLSRTVGTYKIDNEAPIINDIPVTVGNNSAEVKANAIDNHSGIDSYTLTGPSFNKTQKNDTFIVTLPGVYTLTVTDKVGNQTSKEVEVNVYYPITIVWKDENMPPELKPDTIILQAKDGEEVVKEVELPNGTTDYTFKDLPINDDYTFDLIVSDRYDIEVTDQTIVVTYHASNFSVVIPKSITLNGITGTGSYLVKVSGEFFYNDTLTVKPDTGFTLNDRSNISKMTGKVEQTKSVFTKDSLQNARGNISVNRTYFSGIWRGNYHFNVKFVMKN